MWRHTAVSTYKGGACRSDDGGKTWAKSNAGMDETAATHILLDPTSPVDARVLYVSGIWSRRVQERGWRTHLDPEEPGHHPVRTICVAIEPVAQMALSMCCWRDVRKTAASGMPATARSIAQPMAPSTGSQSLLPSGVNAPNGLAVDPRISGSLLPRNVGARRGTAWRGRRNLSLGEWWQELAGGT